MIHLIECILVAYWSIDAISYPDFSTSSFHLKALATQILEVTCDWFPIHSKSLTQSAEQSQEQQWQPRFTLIHQNKHTLNTSVHVSCSAWHTRIHSYFILAIINPFINGSDGFRFNWKLLGTCSIDFSSTAPCVSDYWFDKWAVWGKYCKTKKAFSEKVGLPLALWHANFMSHFKRLKKTLWQ